MSPLKLVVIAILLYLGYRLLISDWKKKRGNNRDEECRKENEPEDEQVEDVLVEDPVCHKLVPKRQAIRLKQEGKQDYVYFCSEECCNKFSQTGEQE
jgi:YHS domain-containing protein